MSSPMSLDRSRLITLRVSIARLAQASGIETQCLPVLDKSFEELAEMAASRERGWVTLLGLISAASSRLDRAGS